MTVTVKVEGNVAHVAMDDGKGNVLGTPMLKALLKVADEVTGANAVLLTGRPKVFCGGLDLVEVGPLARGPMLEFLELFHHTFRAWLAIERPVIVAANGSAVAGGAVLLCCGDVRLGARDAGVVGVNEVRLGVPFPVSAMECVRAALTPPNASRATLFGEIVPKEEALAMGYFTSLHAPEELEERAWERVRDAGTLPSVATCHVKKALRAVHLKRVDELGLATNARFVDLWTAPEAQGRIRKVMETLRRK